MHVLLSVQGKILVLLPGGGGYSALWWYIYVPRPRPPVHISTVVLELIHSMPKGRSKALLFIPYSSSARSGLGSFFKLENAQTFRSELASNYHAFSQQVWHNPCFAAPVAMTDETHRPK